MAAGIAEQIVEAGVVGVRFNEHRVDADGLKIVEPLCEAVQIADAIAVRVLERLRLHAIDNRSLPPRLRTETRASPTGPRERLCEGGVREQQRSGECASGAKPGSRGGQLTGCGPGEDLHR